MTAYRKQRLERELVKIIGNCFLTKIRDDKLNWVSITEVELSPDFQYAKVFFTCMGEDLDRKSLLEKIAKTAGFVKKEIGLHKLFRTMPEIRFVYDITEEKASRVENLIDQIKSDNIPDNIE